MHPKNPNKKIKYANENLTEKNVKEPETFINHLENYKNLEHVNHVKNINYIFNEESNLVPPGNLQSVLILTFLYSTELIQEYLNKGVKFLVASDCQKETLKTTMEMSETNPNLKIIFPKRSFGANAPSSFHPKLYILKFKNILRIVIGSGNLLNCDWNRYGNVFWRKDFLMNLQNAPDEKPNAFTSYLTSFISKSIDPFDKEVTSYLGICFNRYKIDEPNIHLVGSLPGQEEDKNGLKISFNQCIQIVKANPPKTPFKIDTTKVYYVTSSLGSLNFKLLYDFSKIFIHDSDFNWQNAVLKKSQILSMFNVIYPSENYISGTYFGESRANCLFLRRMIYDSFKFEKSVMRSFEGNLNIEGNNSILPHYKIFIITHSTGINDDTIVYIGSHNFTQSAWGKFDKKEDKIEVFNYELGIIWPSKPNSALSKSKLIESFGVCIPAQKYSEHDRPFFVKEN